MLIGYARVSTLDQTLDLQTDALTKAGCHRLFEDKISGSRTERPGLAKALDMLREGDTLVVWKLDRLGRSVKHLVDMVGELHKQGVQFKSLTDAIDTGTPLGTIFLSRHGQPGPDGARTDRGAHPGRIGSCSAAWSPGRAQALDDRQQNRVSQETPGQRRAATGRGQEPWRVSADALSLDSSLLTSLAYDFFRFL